MSDPTPPPPQPPVVLGEPQRPRGVRRLGARPYYIVGAVSAGFVAIAGYAIHQAHQSESSAQAPAAAAPRGNDPNVILAGIPGAGAIPAAGPRTRPGSPPPNTAPTRDAAPSSAPADTPRGPAAAPVDELRQNALKEAWTRYYQDYAQLAATRREAARTALIADTTYASGADPGGSQAQPSPNGTTSSSSGAPTSAGGGTPGPQPRRAPSPGELNQGPSRAADDYLQATTTPPLTKYELKAGDPIQIRFLQGVTSDAPGQFRAVVSQPVFDHATGLHILVPQGAAVIGSYDHLQEVGTERLPAGATRIIYPGESSESLDLGSMPLADQAGYSGLRDDVNHHYGRLILNTALLGIGGAGAQLTQPRSSNPYGNTSASQIIAAQLGLQFGQVGSEYARQQLQAKPTHTIRPGYTGLLQVTQDVAFPGEWVEGTGIVPARQAQ